MSQMTPTDIPRFENLSGYDAISCIAGVSAALIFAPTVTNPIFHEDTARADENRVSVLNGHIASLQAAKHALRDVGDVPSNAYRMLDAKIAHDKTRVHDIQAHAPANGDIQFLEKAGVWAGLALTGMALATASSYFIRKTVYKHHYPKPPKSSDEPSAVSAKV